ncbi:precorrin-8X methylmutase [Deinococcus arenicola]|uniref:Precorrin-8X methylmutase n=1 Tax=Deinococcus arenicola TaxID=2994950 RepID=A0ABU4DTH9_9DEIO|nr:precorrin-8X methylmutase [Deinococcus sp. ZS9-10]MDV6375741.1 precorrin-8X methylmutase [Deinococcus sp. ZS9-10]
MSQTINPPYSIVLAGHGSRDPANMQELEQLVDLMRERAGAHPVGHGYLEFASPTIDTAVRGQLSAGAQDVVVVPGVLLAATHAKNDMPSEVQALQREFPQAHIHFAAAMDLHPLLLKLCQERLVQAEVTSAQTVSRAETCLVVVGRGTTDPDANGDVSKLTRMLEEGLGYGGSLVCFSGTANPRVDEGLKRAVRLGFRRLVVLPYFLFDGVLVKRIRAAVAAAQERHPDTEILAASHLGAHPHVAQVFLERAREGMEGRAHMNCSMCKYRVAVVGYESQVGEAQISHHGAVRGLSGRTEPLPAKVWQRYVPHPIEAESFSLIEAGRDWSDVPDEWRYAAQRLVHTSGNFDIVPELYFSPGAIEAGVRAILGGKTVVTDVTMVQSGLKRELVSELGVRVWCGVHDPESFLLQKEEGITRSAAGVRRAWQKFGNDCILAIGDAPTAIAEAVRLIREQRWRPALVIGLPVGFVGTQESKAALRACLQVPRISNSGTRGGSPWASSVVNAVLIEVKNRLAAASEEQQLETQQLEIQKLATQAES